MTSNFNIPQRPSLKNVIHSFWQADGDTDFKTQTIIPQGIVEIIFNFSKNSAIPTQLGDIRYQLPGCFINGFNTTPIQLQLPQWQTFFGVRLHPTTVSYIFGVSAGEFANHLVDLTLVEPSMNSLWHQLIELKLFNERILAVTNWLENRFLNISSHDILLDNFLNYQQHINLQVTELSRMLCFSPRHLSRKFLALTGMNSEQILLYKKYLQSVNLIHHTKLSLTEIAHSCHFTDQSHFIKTFKSFAEITPGEYKKLKSPLQGHIYRDVR